MVISIPFNWSERCGNKSGSGLLILREPFPVYGSFGSRVFIFTTKGFGIILRARKFFNHKTLLNLYHAFIFPYLIYCVEIWGNARDIHLLPLITLQKKIVRAITFSQYLAHTAEIFIKLDILPFKKLVIHRIGILMFKTHFECVPSVITYFSLLMLLFKSDDHSQ